MFKAVVKKEETDGHLANSSVVNVNEEPSDNDAETSSDNECRNTPTEPSLPSSNRRYNLRKRTTNVPHYDAREARNGSDDDEYDDYDVVSDVEDENVSGARSRPKRYKCTQCDFRASYPCDVKAHSRIHTGERPFACSKCHKRFRTKGLVREHMMTHVTERRHECDQCDYSSKNRRTLYYHQRTKHGMGDIVTCPHEGCTFFHAKPSALRKHIGVHTGVKPFKCKQCQYTARTKEHLRKHVKKCHSGAAETQVAKKEAIARAENAMSSADLPASVSSSNEKVEPLTDSSDVGGDWAEMECVVIDEESRSVNGGSPSIWDDDDDEHGTSTSKNGKQGKLRCPQWPNCPYTTTRPDYMKRHQAVHDDTQRPFTCENCGKGFTQKHILDVHMAVHSDEK
ncbi:gastrula zinc finger protein XlCGF57.1-like protein [Aphelenchoides avenae]|nr:gastrula zinc finger protein XlCGF57.1-like protein [Aphelenchus avenae]